MPRLAPWAHEPGRMPPWVPVRDRTGTNGLARPQPKPCFLLVGVLDLRMQNRALLTKYLYKFFNNRDQWGVLDLVREPRGPAGASWALVPVRVEPFVPVQATNRDQWSSLLAHNHWSRFVA